MIKAENISKYYGKFQALKGISFEVKPNTITALLGPNGAGKTTTLKILSGFFTPDSGDVYILDKKLNTENSNEIKKHIGYIPENNPLYEDIEVVEYLSWISDVYSVPDKKKRLQEVIEKCSLKAVAGKKIATLSKGYRQRVSLAKAIIHNPPILLLDEPTTGLDPNQAQQTRELILELKKDKTILISTHILSEVEHMCEDIIIINNGEIATSGTKNELLKIYSTNSYVLKFEGNVDFNFNEIPEIETITKDFKDDETIYYIKCKDENTDLRKKLINTINKNNLPLLEIYKERVTLDEIFKKITLS